uniref:Cytosolic Fe-S cluster assembly factor NUBP2 homolog n=1 Tax=Arcella intermedia TaxID=1963864 RepID=A0A6B2LE77_9EUKA
MKNSFKKIILVLSGKGGVGKSTVASQLAIILANTGAQVGLLDIDLCGPSIPYLLGLENKSVHSATSGWVPVYPDGTQNLSVMSIGFLLHNRNDAVIWRGPKKSAIIKQFIDDVIWGTLDFLIIDTPPGTSDEHISITEKLLPYHPEAVIVTTPQGVALSDVEKEIAFCRKVDLPILGLVENMSGFVCPTCAECTNIFGEGGGKALSEAEDIPFLGKIPIDPLLFHKMEENKSFAEKTKQAASLQALHLFAKQLTHKLEQQKNQT